MYKSLLLAALMAYSVIPVSAATVNPSGDTTALRKELRIGDPAPELKVRWLKGKPVKKFEKGMVYVLEFWATWCGPCIKAMPHVTELARQYAGKVTMIGVSVWERGKVGQNLEELVGKFVQESGEKMGYPVAMDLGDFMVKNWVEAAGQTSIPATIIVDKAGRIAWVGTPMEMDVPLAQIVAGTFDAKQFAKKISAEQEQAFQRNKSVEKQVEVMESLQHLLEARDYKGVLSRYETAIAELPTYKALLSNYYFAALVHLDPDKAYAEAVALKNDAAAMMIARAFATEVGLDRKFYQYAISYYEKQPEGAGTWPMVSAAYFNNGEVQKAVDTLQKFVDWCNAAKTPPPAVYMEKELLRLKKYKEAL